MKEINISGKSYNIECSAFTYVKFKSFFKESIFESLKNVQTFIFVQKTNKEKITNKNPNISEENLNSLLGEMMIAETENFIISITKIAWILIYTADNSVIEYEKWLKTITNFKVSDEWIVEVAKFVADTF